MWLGVHLPECPADNPPEGKGRRRVARKMHLKRFTNAVFFDGHAGRLQLADETQYPTDLDKYALWLRRFGVKDPETVKNHPRE